MKKTTITFIMRVISTLMTFLMNIYIARLFGAEGSGLFFLVITFLLAASIIGRFGLETSVIKFAAPAWDNADKKHVFGVYIQAVTISIFICIILAIMIYFFSDYLAVNIFNDLRLKELFILISFTVLPYCMIWIHSGILKAIHMPAKATFIEACGISLFTISILFIYSLDNSISYTDSIIAYCFATIITFLIGMAFVFRYTFTREKPTFENTNDLFKVSYPIMWYAGLKFIINWSPIFFLGVLYTSVEVGLYAVAFRISMLVTFLLIVVNSITPAPIATLYKNKKFKQLQDYTKTVAVNTTKFALPLVFVFILWPEKILLLFGPEFIDANYLLIIMVLGRFVQVLTGSVDNLLMMTGYENQLKNSMVIVAIIAIILNLILINNYGALGAALTTAICISIRNIFAAWLVYHYLGIKLFPNFSEIIKINN